MEIKERTSIEEAFRELQQVDFRPIATPCVCDYLNNMILDAQHKIRLNLESLDDMEHKMNLLRMKYSRMKDMKQHEHESRGYPKRTKYFYSIPE